jgi:hypothetical protein
LEDRAVPTGVAANYAVTQDWSSGFQAQISLVNQQASAVPNWTLAFDYSASIAAIWDAKVLSHSGNHYVIGNAGWNSTLATGGSVSFGFNASSGQTSATPANYLLNGLPLNGPALPSLSIGDVSVDQGTSATSAAFTVSLSAAATAPVTVAYATADGTARAGTDYQSVSGTLTFAPGQTQQTITVPINPATQANPDRTFFVNLASPDGATLTRAQAVGTIKDTVVPPASGDFQFQVTSDWGSGFTGQLTIHNSTSATVTSWSLEFDLPAQISSVWDAAVVSHIGSHYVVQNAGWNSNLAPGATVSFGFTASPGNLTTGATNFVLHSGPVNPTGGGTNQPPLAGNVFASTTPGQPVTVNVLASDSDPDGDPLHVTSAGQGQNGSVVLNANGTITYSPKAGFSGSDSFAYAVSDGRGGTASATVTVSVGVPTASSWPAHFFAPYVDMTLYPTYDLASAARSAGIRYFTLAFIVADSQNQPSWGGYQAYEVNGGSFDQQMRTQLAAVRSLGGDVMVSFGGAANQELAQSITNVAALTNAYQSVITAYNLTHIDFDIEGAAEADHASIDRRSQAIAALQSQANTAGRELDVWFTLPVLPSGLTADGLYVLQSALRNGVRISGVNVMAMDYGESAAPNPQGNMGGYAIQAATSLFGQLGSLYGSSRTAAQLWQMVGVTPMIGLNDDTNEVFNLQAAQQLAAFAAQNGMGRISMWSLNRDRQNSAGAISYVEATSSSLAQNPFDFSRALLVFVS